MADRKTSKQPSSPETQTKQPVSRRQILHGVVATAGGVALFASVEPAAALMPQKAAKYQATPKGNASCANCSHFQAPSSCGLVQGPISPHGWCMFYVKK